MNGSELRAKFLENAEDVVVSVTNSATGKPDHILENPLIDEEAYSKTWDLARDIILASTDAVKIEARTTEGIINAVCNGNITIIEAKELMGLLQTKQNIDELPNLIVKLEELESE